MIYFDLYGHDAKEDCQSLAEDSLSLLQKVQEGEALYQQSLDWMDPDICAGKEQLKRILAKAQEIRAKADVFVLIGVGGSNNAARAVIEALQAEDDPMEIIYAGNSLNPYAMQKVLRQLEGKEVYIDCIAKNFETLEPGSSFRILRSFLQEKYKEDAPSHIITCGTEGSSLHELSLKEGYDFFGFPLHVGGRFSALTNVGLLPMAVAGIDIVSLVQGARAQAEDLTESKDAMNMALRYACYRNVCYRKGYRMEMLSSFEPRFRYFYQWWIQLFAESEGKEDKGIYPISGEFSEELHSVGQFLQEGSPIIFESFLWVKGQDVSLRIPSDGKRDFFDYLNSKDLWDINQKAYQATLAAHAKRLPVACFEIDSFDAYHFGQLYYFFFFACYLSCRIMGVNPFDQPGVEAYKERMFDALGRK